MKKTLFFAFAVAGMLCGCSSEDAIGLGNYQPEDDGLVPIKLGISCNNVVSTRGTGTVGGVVDERGNEVEANLWAGQKFYVYMLEKGTVHLAEFSDLTSKDYIYRNDTLIAPTGSGAGLATLADGTNKYFPSTGNYDFWAYHLDNASIGVPVEGTDSIYTSFEIDGTQDIMVAKAAPSSSEIALLGAKPDAFYSAYAARRNVQPNLSFKHLLSRLKFKMLAGNASTAESVKITGITVKSKTTGTLTIAYAGETEKEQIWFTPGQEKKELKLMQRAAGSDNNTPLVDLETVDLQVDASVEVGEALLVAPDNDYELTIYFTQDFGADGGVKPFKVTDTIRTPSKAPFLSGHSYNVTVTIYEFIGVEISTELVPWTEDSDSNIDMDLSDE